MVLEEEEQEEQKAEDDDDVPVTVEWCWCCGAGNMEEDPCRGAAFASRARRVRHSTIPDVEPRIHISPEASVFDPAPLPSAE